ncbi:hypothetical protein DL766_003392 [Monosporascus sp. MC13-8B]|uniref:Transmembrane protein n=1 Tax=Monosporascus cannonballus TaxID=155416 RepID=A0ABY0H273_9PEZI|nr:hypothetical protein DL762_006394 [Monosporascus cannonballus]RYO89069.1 hypothetical protein DL763_005779 [Monosporascus cannonballus]RYP33556.1 hypothetical protein DL766_003392 [Monosporascus sp. MC13-8B]
MTDVYTPAPDSSSYLLATPFSMPSDRGDRWAVSFTGNSAALLVAALSTIIAVSFLCLWNFICFIAMLFDGNATRRRYVALVTLWNSNESWFAFKELLSYTYQCATYHPNSDPYWGDVAYGLVFCIIALAVFGGSIAMGIVGPSLVQIGNVAPPQPSTLFYPRIPAADDPVQQLQEFGLRAPGLLRALGSVEAARVELRSRVLVDADTSYPDRENGDRVIGLKYGYSLSGLELGLQGGIDLELAVEGSCITEYGWYVESAEDDEVDMYHLWNNANDSAWVLLNLYETQHAPRATFHLHSQGVDQLLSGSNVSYAIIASSARRSSISPGSDPWYATEPRDEHDPRFDAGHWIKRQRPVLSCWEQNRWRYGTQNVASVYELKNIPGMAIPTVLLEVLETTFTVPMIVRLGNASGGSALRSGTRSLNGVIDAHTCSIYDDIERLILASFVASRNVFSDATMFGQSGNYPNIFTSPNGQPGNGAANFVVSSPDIQTFSLTGIVTLAAISVVPIMARCAAWWLVRVHNGRQDPQLGANKWTRFHVLTAVQLFRCMYEPGADTQSRQWNCAMPVPDELDENSFRLVPNKCQAYCKGHIDKDTVRMARCNDSSMRGQENTGGMAEIGKLIADEPI